MMRIIKFRVWNKISKEMSFFDTPMFELACSCRTSESHVKFANLKADKIMLGGYSEPMQYTGLKDKNDVEIFESDIVKDKNGSFGQLIYDDENMSFAIGTGVKYNGWLHPCASGAHASSIKVIGNVFENPELLEE